LTTSSATLLKGKHQTAAIIELGTLVRKDDCGGIHLIENRRAIDSGLVRQFSAIVDRTIDIAAAFLEVNAAPAFDSSLGATGKFRAEDWRPRRVRKRGDAKGHDLRRRLRRVTIDALMLPAERGRQRLEVSIAKIAVLHWNSELVALAHIAHVDGTLDLA